MFVSDKLVFVELHKTGSSHIRQLLSETVEGQLVGKHTQVPPDLFVNDRIFLGSIRNPWDWYVSLWAFGCSGKGSLRHTLVQNAVGKNLRWKREPFRKLTSILKRNSHREAWLATYRNSQDPAAFKDWLHMLSDPSFCLHIGEGYSDCDFRHTIGLLTYRYLKLFSTMKGEESRLTGLKTKQQVVAWDRENTFVQEFIRLESLSTDFLRVLNDYVGPISESKRSSIFLRPKKNMSARKRELRHYYDPDTIALVAEREQFIVEKFGYSQPHL